MNLELKNSIKLDKSWLQELEPEFKKQYMQELKLFLQSEKKKGKEIYPKGKDMFRALNLTPLDQVKAVIIGQDPYHGPGQAHGLESWAKQGVLLLNSVLSVEKGLANSHSSKGWELFTDSVISKVNEKEAVVFLLWGNYAAQKGNNIDSNKHLVLKSVHPSPLSAHPNFFGNKHFSKCNEFLESKGISSIDWTVKPFS